MVKAGAVSATCQAGPQLIPGTDHRCHQEKRALSRPVWLRGDLRPVLSLRCLLRDTEHRPDLGPTAVSLARGTHRLGEFRFDFVTPLRQVSDGPQGLSVSLL